MTTWQRLEAGSAERRLCLAMNRWGARHALRRFFGVISRLGDGVFWYALMAVLATFGGTRGIVSALHMALIGIVAATMYKGLKRWTRRPRPFRTHDAIIPYVAPLDEFSFPSGHTLHAVSFTWQCAAHFPELLLVLVPLAALIAASRVVLGLHYPSDVLAGAALGAALAALGVALA